MRQIIKEQLNEKKVEIAKKLLIGKVFTYPTLKLGSQERIDSLWVIKHIDNNTVYIDCSSYSCPELSHLIKQKLSLFNLNMKICISVNQRIIKKKKKIK